MLAEAQRLRAQGLDIVVGVVETHGRKDTAAMLEGLAVLPLKRQAYRGRHISEFDLDAALARRPALILMDELAHSNAPGSRHPKRWQDIEELLEAGIDVFTTVNVQHLESLNDVVSGVTKVGTGNRARSFFRSRRRRGAGGLAPGRDLRQRLKEGKVYIAGQAERAIEHFFRKGNLIALRELALRRTARIALMSKCAPGGGILAKRKSGTRATRSFYASAITPAAKNWSARRRGWRHGWGASGTRCMLKPLPCIAYRRKNVGQFSAPYVWRRSWARRRQHF